VHRVSPKKSPIAQVMVLKRAVTQALDPTMAVQKPDKGEIGDLLSDSDSENGAQLITHKSWLFPGPKTVKAAEVELNVQEYSSALQKQVKPLQNLPEKIVNETDWIQM
jgi:hypothetical protein